MLKRCFYISIISLLFAIGTLAQTPQSGTDVVLVLPFENTSGKAEFNWVGESFADSLSDLLRVPNLNVITNEERKLIQQRLRIPLTTLPSLATSLKLARDAKATMLITGRYNILPEEKDIAASIVLSVKVIRVNEGRFISETSADGTRTIPPFDLTDALDKLQTMQGRIAYKILHFHEKSSMTISENAMVERASRIPAKAFEAYIKGLLTPGTSLTARENYFKNASRLYTDKVPDGVYSEAELELGHLYLSQRKGNEAVSSFERVVSASQNCREKARLEKKPAQCNDENFAEAGFYIGLLYLQQGNFESALATLQPLADDLKLTTVYNALGTISVQASRAERKDQAKAAGMLKKGTDFLKQAVDSDPGNLNIHFNYGVALFLMGGNNLNEAADQFRASIGVKNATDGEAYYLLAKTLELLNDPNAQKIDSDAQRLLGDTSRYPKNRYAGLETKWKNNRQFPDIPLRVEQPSRKDFVAVVLSSRSLTPKQPQMNETEVLLAKARTQLKEGQDDDAMATLRRVLASEPMSAESYLLLGKISLRRGDKDQAISQFKTSIFWDNKLIDAHVELGKIYVEKGDCMQAKNYAASATEIDKENADAAALQRLSERCSK